MSRLLIRARYPALAATLAALAFLIAQGKHVRYEQSIESFFAEDDPAVVAYKQAAETFGNDQFVFVAYDDPELITPAGMDRVAELAAALGPGKVEGVLSVQSLDAMPVLWQIDDQLLNLAALGGFARTLALNVLKKAVSSGAVNTESMTIADAVRSADAAGREQIKKRLTEHPLFEGTLIDRRGTTTAIVVRLASPEDHDVKVSIQEIRAAARAFARRHRLERPAVVGPPALLADGFINIEKDGRRLALVGMLLIGLVTLTATRSPWWAAVPLLAGWTVWLAAEWVLATLDLRLSLSGGPLVAQIIVLTMPAASHLALHFRDDLRQTGDRRAAAPATLAAVTGPILWCAATGTLGYGALLTSNVVPIRQFGGVLAICTALAAVLTLAISPVAMLPPLRLGRGPRREAPARTTAMLEGLTRHVVRHPTPIVLGTLAVVVPIACGVSRLHYESNYINAFRPETEIVQDYRFVEGRLGGIGLVYLVEPAGATIDPEALRRFAELDRRVAALERPDGSKAVDHVVSLATVLDPDGRLAALPEDRRAWALRTKLDLIALSPQAELLRGFWNPDAARTRTMIRLKEQQPAPAKQATFDAAAAEGRALFGEATYLAGLSALLTEVTRGVIATQWSTFTWATCSILLMLTLAFRGPRLAALAILPTMLAVGLALGLMGWLGVKLDLATALVASVALGLSVDDTFHCLLQFRRLRRTEPFERALLGSYRVTGPGVLLSSAAVAIGFGVLMLSQFTPFANFGAMVGIATAGSSLGNLVLLPACLALGHRLAARWGGMRPAGGEAAGSPVAASEPDGA